MMLMVKENGRSASMLLVLNCQLDIFSAFPLLLEIWPVLYALLYIVYIHPV